MPRRAAAAPRKPMRSSPTCPSAGSTAGCASTRSARRRSATTASTREIDDLSAAGRQKRRRLQQEAAGRTRCDRRQPALAREPGRRADPAQPAASATSGASRRCSRWAWDPQVYNGLAGGAIYNLMAREFAPMPQRLKSATARMEKIPALFAQMRENLDPARVPKIHAETVAKQNAGVLSLVDTFIAPERRPVAGRGPQAAGCRDRRPAQGRRRTADVARQDAGAERQGRLPHRRRSCTTRSCSSR